MVFEALVRNLELRLQSPLPGIRVHEVLRAKPIGNVLPKFEHRLPPKPGGVLILLYEEEGLIKFPLIKRPTYTGAHSGQISLPGGKAEPGEDIFQTALREGEEEIGVKQKDIRIIGKLSEFNVIPSNFLVTPVIAMIDYAPEFIPDQFEVEKVIQADLFELAKEDAIRESEILAAGLYPMMAPHFLIENEIVWGATAMMLNEFRMIVMELSQGK
jgi:8-oxo-dGTP pyrophosphatase MutT (NUDIX family)